MSAHPERNFSFEKTAWLGSWEHIPGSWCWLQKQPFFIFPSDISNPTLYLGEHQGWWKHAGLSIKPRIAFPPSHPASGSWKPVFFFSVLNEVRKSSLVLNTEPLFLALTLKVCCTHRWGPEGLLGTHQVKLFSNNTTLSPILFMCYHLEWCAKPVVGETAGILANIPHHYTCQLQLRLSLMNW